MEISASAHWQTVDFLSDLHLDSADAPTTDAFLRYLKQTPAQALVLLGDIFEVWIFGLQFNYHAIRSFLLVRAFNSDLII